VFSLVGQFDSWILEISFSLAAVIMFGVARTACDQMMLVMMIKILSSCSGLMN